MAYWLIFAQYIRYISYLSQRFKPLLGIVLFKIDDPFSKEEVAKLDHN